MGKFKIGCIVVASLALLPEAVVPPALADQHQ
jgi:hypothetical protein